MMSYLFIWSILVPLSGRDCYAQICEKMVLAARNGRRNGLILGVTLRAVPSADSTM